MRSIMRDDPNKEPGFMQQMNEARMSLLNLVTTDPFEMGMMLRKADPNIGVVQAPPEDGGEFFAVRRILDDEGNQTGERIVNLNRKGLSGADAMQVLGITALSMIPGAPKTMAGRMTAAGGMQAGIQGAQEASGGEFSGQEVITDTLLQGGLDAAGNIFKAFTRPKTSGTIDPALAAEVTKLAEASSPGQVIDAAKTLDLDPVVLEAAEALGVPNIPLSAASRNIRYRQIDQALRSQIGSKGGEEQILALQQLSDNAQSMIEVLGASDRFGISQDVVRSIENQINSFKKLGDDIFYNPIKEVIPKSTVVDTAPLMDYFERQIADFGGVDMLPSQEKLLYNKIKDGEPLTYHALDSTRKRIGTARRAAEQGTDGTPAYELKQFEDALLDNQEAAIAALDPTLVNQMGPAANFSDRFALARSLTAQRKNLESAAQKVFGRDMAKDLMAKFTSNLKRGVQTGDLHGFRQAMNVIPQEFQADVILTAVDDILREGGRGQSGMNMPKFAAWYKTLKSSPVGYKEITGYLNKEQIDFLDNLGTVTQGWSNAMRDQVNTGRIIPFLQQFDKQGNWLQNLVNIAPSQYAGMASSVTTAMSKAGPTALDNASGLLNDPIFRTMAIKYMRGEATESLFDRLLTHKAFKTWLGALPAESKKKVLSKGLMFYLTDDEAAANSVDAVQRAQAESRAVETGINQGIN
tara:strand:- start:1836 stop:3914 length:2079 start_codon:yes stop_codon:yes gene_type:complete